MSRPISIKKNTLANYIGQFYTIFIGIFILPFYLKYLGAEAYGLVGFFNVLMSWMTLLDMGLSATLQRETARLKDKINGLFEIKRLIISVEIYFLAISVIIFMLVFFGSHWLATHWLDLKALSIDTADDSIKIMAFILVTRWFVGFYSGSIMGFEEQVWLNIYKAAIATLKFIGAFLLIAYVSNDITHFFIYQLAVSIAEFFIIKLKMDSFFKGIEKPKPSISRLKEIAPFALSIAYAGGIWLFITQIDKLMLSHYLPLEQYGYFTLVVVVANAILQLFQPIGQAILPRMASLLSNAREQEMISLYHKSTQLAAIIILSVSGMIATFSYELLYSWSGDIKVSTWAAPVLFWYALGNGAVALLSFQYYMQFAYGNLKYNVKGNTYFGFIQIAVMIYAVHFYGAIGAGIAWFGLQLFFLIFWPSYIHSKFAPGIHKEWVIKDILPILLSSIVYLSFLRHIHFSFNNGRVAIFIMLVLFGVGMLVINTMASEVGREYMRKIILKENKDVQ